MIIGTLEGAVAMKLRILIIDDDGFCRNRFKWHLEKQGHEVVTLQEPLHCGVYCGDYCRQEKACGHIYLISDHLPRMTGLEYIEKMVLRGCKSLPTNKIVMAGNTTGVDPDRVRKVGCQVVDRPLSLERLDQLVEFAQATVDPRRELADLSASMGKGTA